jgi:hypothetical protein
MWKELDKNNLPEKEVLAANFKARTYGYKEKLLGYLSKDLGEITCESDNEVLNGCTHYIAIHDFDTEA